MFIPAFVTLCTLVAAEVSATNVRHIELNDAHLIDFGSNQYALSTPEFKQNDWISVLVNGDEAVVMTSDCDHIFMSDASRFKAVHDSLNSIDPTTLSSSDRHSSSAYPIDSTSVLPNRSKNIDFTVTTPDGLVLHTDSDGNVAAAGSLIPNYSRVFVLADVVVFVDSEGKIVSKPRDCLDDPELDVVQTILERS